MAIKRRRFFQGYYKPKNPKKYRGDVKNIVYRSGWEFRVMRMLDIDPNVVGWNSEETVIRYISPIDGKPHRYFIDMTVETKNGKQYLVEIKPYAQTQPPIKGTKKQATYLAECQTYAVNQQKWRYATEWANERGMEFLVLTEKQIDFNKK